MSEQHGHQHFDDHIRQTTVVTDFNKPLIARTTRWEYLARYIPLWKSLIRYRAYMWACIVLAAIAVLSDYSFFVVPLAGAAGYFFLLQKMVTTRVASSRKVIIGH
jgi:hypothetical protein